MVPRKSTVLFLGGMVLFTVDWRADFGLLWPAMVATRMVPIGLLLLVTELVIFIEARRKNVAKNDHLSNYPPHSR
jgi:hypothetical protein